MSLESTIPAKVDSLEGAGKSLKSLIARLAALIASANDGKRPGFGPGDVAALRRLAPDSPWCPAFWRIAAGFLEPARQLGGGPNREEAERRWAVILSILAHASSLHTPSKPLGAALAEAGFSEMRLLQLLRAEAASLLAAALQAARFLAAKGQEADLAQLADLVLSDGKPHADEVRRRVARSYYSSASLAE